MQLIVPAKYAYLYHPLSHRHLLMCILSLLIPSFFLFPLYIPSFTLLSLPSSLFSLFLPFPFSFSSPQQSKLTTTTTAVASHSKISFLSIKHQMKQLIRRLSRVADASAQYSLLRSDSTAQRTATRHRGASRRAESFLVAVSSLKKQRRWSVPEGHVPVYVGEEMERFVVSAELLNHPVFIGLLNKSAQEYGYDQKGVLHIPCQVLVFERVMEALRLGVASPDLQDLLSSFSDDCFFEC